MDRLCDGVEGSDGDDLKANAEDLAPLLLAAHTTSVVSALAQVASRTAGLSVILGATGEQTQEFVDRTLP